MVVYKFDSSARKRWKDYPIRIRSPHPSHCHNQPTWVVRSQSGGFVTANCSSCGAKETLTEHEFLNLGVCVACPNCAQMMGMQKMPSHHKAPNYSFVCQSCKVFVVFADLLPDWKDIRWAGSLGGTEGVLTRTA